jgi:hypothetical protein
MVLLILTFFINRINVYFSDRKLTSDVKKIGNSILDFVKEYPDDNLEMQKVSPHKSIDDKPWYLLLFFANEELKF